MVIEQYIYTFIWDVGGVKRHQLSIKLHITYHGLPPKVSYSMIITYMNHSLGYNHVLYSIICHRLDRILENVHIPKWCFLLMLFRRCDASTWDLAYKFHEKKAHNEYIENRIEGYETENNQQTERDNARPNVHLNENRQTLAEICFSDSHPANFVTTPETMCAHS